MTLLVAGADGFIGRHLLAELPPRQVVALGRGPLAVPAVEYHRVDLLTAARPPRLRRRPTRALILTYVGKRRTHNARTQARLLAENVRAVTRLAGWLRRWGVRHTVLVSSTSVYDLGSTARIDEASPARPTGNTDSVYGMIKLAQEETLRRLLPAPQLTIVRLTGVFGPGMNPKSLPALWRRAAGCRHRLTVRGGGRNRMDYLYVADAVRALRLALRLPGGTYNITGNGRMTNGRFARGIARACGLPATACRTIAAGRVKRGRVDGTRFAVATGFAPRYSLAAALAAWRAAEP